MRFYLVDKIGDGTKDNPFRPNLSNMDFVSLKLENTFLVGVNGHIEGLEDVNLLNVCTTNNLKYSDVLAWFVGEA